MAKYTVLTGCNYIPKGGKAEVRREPGDVVTDLTAAAEKALIKMGAIEEVEAK